MLDTDNKELHTLYEQYLSGAVDKKTLVNESDITGTEPGEYDAEGLDPSDEYLENPEIGELQEGYQYWNPEVNALLENETLSEDEDEGHMDVTSHDGAEPHSHVFHIDDEGHGCTVAQLDASGEEVPEDHDHTIVNFDVLPTGMDNHDHEIDVQELSEKMVNEANWTEYKANAGKTAKEKAQAYINKYKKIPTGDTGFTRKAKDAAKQAGARMQDAAHQAATAAKAHPYAAAGIAAGTGVALASAGAYAAYRRYKAKKAAQAVQEASLEDVGKFGHAHPTAIKAAVGVVAGGMLAHKAYRMYKHHAQKAEEARIIAAHHAQKAEEAAMALPVTESEINEISKSELARKAQARARQVADKFNAKYIAPDEIEAAAEKVKHADAAAKAYAKSFKGKAANVSQFVKRHPKAAIATGAAAGTALAGYAAYKAYKKHQAAKAQKTNEEIIQERMGGFGKAYVGLGAVSGAMGGALRRAALAHMSGASSGETAAHAVIGGLEGAASGALGTYGVVHTAYNMQMAHHRKKIAQHTEMAHNARSAGDTNAAENHEHIAQYHAAKLQHLKNRKTEDAAEEKARLAKY